MVISDVQFEYSQYAPIIIIDTQFSHQAVSTNAMEALLSSQI